MNSRNQFHSRYLIHFLVQFGFRQRCYFRLSAMGVAIGRVANIIRHAVYLDLNEFAISQACEAFCPAVSFSSRHCLSKAYKSCTVVAEVPAAPSLLRRSRRSFLFLPWTAVLQQAWVPFGLRRNNMARLIGYCRHFILLAHIGNNYAWLREIRLSEYCYTNCHSSIALICYSFK